MRLLLIFGLLIAAVLASRISPMRIIDTNNSPPGNPGPSTGSFFIVSDVHMDDTYDPYCDVSHSTHCRVCPDEKSKYYFPMGQYGCDAPYSLVVSAFQQMVRVNPNPDFILVTGDFAAHYINSWEDKIRLVTNVTQTLLSFFPNTTIVPVIGNEDVFPSFHLPYGPSATLSSMADAWRQWMDKSARDSFEQGGYYSVVPERAPGLRVVVLNTLFYGKHFDPSNTSASANETVPFQKLEDPAGQFAWLKELLKKARHDNESVVLASHIPPGASRSFRHAWDESYTKAYAHIINKYADVVKAQFFGHLHRDLFRILHDPVDDNVTTSMKHDKGDSSIFLTSSISPIDGNNPSFRYVLYDRPSGEPLNMIQYFANITHVDQPSVDWEELYNFQEAYNITSLEVKQMVALDERFLSGDERLLEVFQLYANEFGIPLTGDNLVADAEYFCSLNNFTNSTLAACETEQLAKRTRQPHDVEEGENL